MSDIQGNSMIIKTVGRVAVAIREVHNWIIFKSFRGSSRVSRALSGVEVAIGERDWINFKAFRGSSRVSRCVCRVAVAIRKSIGSFLRHSGEAAELVWL